MLLLAGHVTVKWILGIIMMSAVMMSPGAVLAEPEKLDFQKRAMNKTIDATRTKALEATFLQALGKHQGIIYKLCRVYCNNRADEEDLFQEIVYQLWKAFPSFGEKSKLSTWIYSVALKTAVLPYRQNRVKIELPEELPEIPGPSDDTTHRSQYEFFRFFHTLTVIDRGIVALLMEGYERKEIAAIVGISEEAVTMRVTRLKKKFNTN